MTKLLKHRKSLGALVLFGASILYACSSDDTQSSSSSSGGSSSGGSSGTSSGSSSGSSGAFGSSSGSSGSSGGSSGASSSGDGGMDGGKVEFTLGGTITDLKGSGLVLANGADTVAPAANATTFSFGQKLQNGVAYMVSAKTQPTNPAQTCTIDKGAGTATANVNNVNVTCVTNAYSINVSLAGLSGAGLVLQNNGGDDLSVAAAATKAAFATKIESGKAFAVTIKRQPEGQVCAVAGGSGTVAAGDVSSVTINCEKTFTIGGTVSGVSGAGLVLQNNMGDDVAINMNGTFAFPTPLVGGKAYAVTVKAQPTNPSETCVVTDGSGTVAAANVTNIAVVCTKNKYTVGGNVSGLNGAGLTLTNNNGDDLPVAADGVFTFATSVESGGAFDVKVKTQPTTPWQTCSVTSGMGTVTNANVTNVAISCETNKYKVGGTVIDLRGTGLVLAQNGTNLPAINANGAFSVDLASGSNYSFTIVTQPTAPAQTCSLKNGMGTVAGADINNVIVRCEKVLLVGAPSTPTWADDVKAKLIASGVDEVDLFNARNGTPTLAQLQGYTAALVYSDSPFQNPAQLGNVLADYFDGGGKVVIATFANASVSPPAGRWAAGNYQLINATGQIQPNDQGNIMIDEPASPLVNGVTSLKAQAAYQSFGGAINGGVVVARWSTGGALIVRGTKNGRNYASINMYPPSSAARTDFWVGSGAEIMRNALRFE
jgi:hypothetical protein